MITEVQWSYMAGIIDGEGCISTRLCRGENPLPRIYIQQGPNGYPLIEWILSIFSKGQLGQYRSRYWKNKGWNHRWSVTKVSSVEFILRGTLPFLTIKKEQAILAIEACQGQKLSRERRFQIHSRLKELKRIKYAHL